ncbi:MAG: CBS domain-containing protein [Pseudomonadota bacterium]|jgi:CBS domain-containing protein
MNVRDCMTPDVRTIDPHSTIREAANMMRELDAGALPVGENDRLIGMITDRDIAIRAVANGKDSNASVRDVMTDDLRYVFDDDDVEEAARCMSEHKVRRLPVINRDKRLVGIISLGDLAQSGRGPSGEALSGVTQPGGPHVQH